MKDEESSGPGRSPLGVFGALILILALLVTVRGVIRTLVLPPFEGFDELSHVAYLVFLDETGDTPVCGEAEVPSSVFQIAVQHPHSPASMKVLKHIGALDYRTFWTREPTLQLGLKIPLGACFHPPLYYHLATALFNRLQDERRFLTASSALRLINNLLTGLAAGLILLAFTNQGRIQPSGLAAAALFPMLTVYTTRVSPDALMLVLYGATFFMASRLHTSPRPWLLGLGMGLCIGAGLWVRSTIIMWLPILLLHGLVLLATRSMKPARALLALALAFAATAAIMAPLVQHNVHHYGEAFPSQEGIRLKWEGKSSALILQTSSFQEAAVMLFRDFFPDSLWTSGMTFIKPPPWIVYAVLAILVIHLLRLLPLRRPLPSITPGMHPDFKVITSLVLIQFVVVFIGTYFHARACILVYGKNITPAYYLTPALLPLIAWLAGSSSNWANYRLGQGLNLLLALLLLGMEIYGTFFQALPAWTSTLSFARMLERTAQMHAAWFSPRWLYFLIPLLALLLYQAFSRTGLTTTRETS